MRKEIALKQKANLLPYASDKLALLFYFFISFFFAHLLVSCFIFGLFALLVNHSGKYF